jgi:polyferredoxin
VAGVRTRKAGTPGLWRIKWFVWAPWLTALVSGWAVAGLDAVIPGWNPGYPAEQDFVTSVGGGTLMATFVTVILVVPAPVAGRRASCHTLCWMSPFLIPGRKLGTTLRLPGFGLIVQNDACIACGQCTTACPMGVPVQLLVQSGNPEHRECILCADCVDTCPKQVLAVRFREKRSGTG